MKKFPMKIARRDLKEAKDLIEEFEGLEKRMNEILKIMKHNVVNFASSRSKKYIIEELTDGDEGDSRTFMMAAFLFVISETDKPSPCRICLVEIPCKTFCDEFHDFVLNNIRDLNIEEGTKGFMRTLINMMIHHINDKS